MTDTHDRLSVLVVDDDRDTADSLAVLLYLAGYHARAAYGGIEAQRLAAAEWPDVVVLDLLMPGVDGWELAHRLHPAPPARRPLLVALTGCGGGRTGGGPARRGSTCTWSSRSTSTCWWACWSGSGG